MKNSLLWLGNIWIEYHGISWKYHEMLWKYHETGLVDHETGLVDKILHQLEGQTIVIKCNELDMQFLYQLASEILSINSIIEISLAYYWNVPEYNGKTWHENLNLLLFLTSMFTCKWHTNSDDEFRPGRQASLALPVISLIGSLIGPIGNLTHSKVATNGMNPLCFLSFDTLEIARLCEATLLGAKKLLHFFMQCF